jgi:predicted Zn-dependent protease
VRPRARAVVWGALGVLTTGCGGHLPSLQEAITPTIGALGRGVIARPTFTEADEARLARESSGKFEAENAMVNDRLLEAYVGRLVQRIGGVAKPRPFAYRVRVVNNTGFNALTFGGGFVYVNAGLLARVESEAQLAMVLAHEVAHVTESHVTRGIQAEYGIQVLGQVAQSAAATAAVPVPAEALAKAYEYTMNAAINGHGRSQESEADDVGLEYTVRAGWDPREAIRVFEVLKAQHADSSALKNFFWENHPTSAARLARLTELITTKYAERLRSAKLVRNTTEFGQRTRDLVVAVAVHDFERGRLEVARSMFARAAAVHESGPVPHHYLGRIALEPGGDPVQAIAHLVKAIEADERYAPAFRELGLALSRHGERQKAVAAFRRYLELAPGAEDAGQIKGTLRRLERR